MTKFFRDYGGFDDLAARAVKEITAICLGGALINVLPTTLIKSKLLLMRWENGKKTVFPGVSCLQKQDEDCDLRRHGTSKFSSALFCMQHGVLCQCS